MEEVSGRSTTDTHTHIHTGESSRSQMGLPPATPTNSNILATKIASVGREVPKSVTHKYQTPTV